MNKMFCPNCGKGEQHKNAYCRSCGEYLPDFENIRKRGFATNTPEENVKSSLFLSSFSSIVGLVMAILLYATFLGKEGAHPLIYLSAAFFTVIGIWQAINVFTGLNLKKQISQRREISDEVESEQRPVNPAVTRELLNEPDFDNMVPASVTEKTTTNLSEKVKIKSS